MKDIILTFGKPILWRIIVLIVILPITFYKLLSMKSVMTRIYKNLEHVRIRPVHVVVNETRFLASAYLISYDKMVIEE